MWSIMSSDGDKTTSPELRSWCVRGDEAVMGMAWCDPSGCDNEVKAQFSGVLADEACRQCEGVFLGRVKLTSLPDNAQSDAGYTCMHDTRQCSLCLASAWSRARPYCETPAYRRQARPRAGQKSTPSHAVDITTHVKVHQLEHSQLCPRIPEAVIILHKRVSFRCRVDGFDVDDGYVR
jgi:hypothetical protein